jgi:hypothetical protein
MFHSYFHNGRVPPCPDPDRYILVRTKEGMHWRRKRGSVKKAKLNDALQQSAVMLRQCSAMSRRIRARLGEYFSRLETGRLHLRVCARLRHAMKETGHARLQCLEGLEIQERFPLERLLTGWYSVTVKDGMVDVRIPVGADTIKQNSGIVTGYFFQLIIVYGDCMEEYGLRVEEETSEVYMTGQEAGECRMLMVLPEKEWMVLLKVCCMEGKEKAKAARNYGMRVVAAGT